MRSLLIRLRNCAEEKILAIEEIRREESKSKMLLAEAMAAGTLFRSISSRDLLSALTTLSCSQFRRRELRE